MNVIQADSSLSKLVLIPPKLSDMGFIDLRSYRSMLEVQFGSAIHVDKSLLPIADNLGLLLRQEHCFVFQTQHSIF